MNSILRTASVLSLVAAGLAAHGQVNLVKNPGFESAGAGSVDTGKSLDGGFWYAGATVSGGNGSLYVVDDSTYTISGARSADLYDGASLFQTLATATSASYLVAFDAYGFTSSGSLFTVGFGASSTTLVAPDGFATSSNSATHFSFLQTASAAATRLSFAFTGKGEDGFVLDNVSVTAVQAVPEPSALAALGLGAVAMLRRRKRA